MQHVLCDQLPSILFRDDNGYWRPLNHLYWSQSSQVLVARHPNSTTEETVSHYCPQCLTRYSDEEAKQFVNRCLTCMQCPHCESPTSTIGNYLVCGMCMWTSSEKDSLQSNCEMYNTTYIAKSAFQILLRNFNELDVASNPSIHNYEKLFTKSKKGSMDDNFEDRYDVGNKNYSAKDTFSLKSCEFQPFPAHSSAQISTDFQAASNAQRLLDPSSPTTCEDKILPPFRTVLQTKRTVRSRSDLEAGRMNILVQSKSFPLEGDSSLKIQRGKWWPKDSSAVLQLPSFVLRRLPDIHSLLRGRYSDILLFLTNPKETELSVRFLPTQKNRRLSTIGRLSSGSASTGGGGIVSSAPAAAGDQDEEEDCEDFDVNSNKGAKTSTIDPELSSGDWEDAEGVERRYLEAEGARGRWLGDIPSIMRLSVAPLPVGGFPFTLSGFEDELLRDEDDDEDDDEEEEEEEAYGGSSSSHFYPQLAWRASQNRHSALVRVPVKLSERQREKVERLDRSREGSGQLLFELRLHVEVVSEKKISTSLPARVFFTLLKESPHSN